MKITTAINYKTREKSIVEGAILGDYFLSKEEFIEVWTRVLTNTTYKTNLFLDIHNLLEVLKNTKDNGEKAYVIWLTISVKYFHNSPVSLLTVLDFNNERLDLVYHTVDEYHALNRNGLLNARVASINNDFKRIMVSNQLSLHLQDLFNTIRTLDMTYEEIGYLIRHYLAGSFARKRIYAYLRSRAILSSDTYLDNDKVSSHGKKNYKVEYNSIYSTRAFRPIVFGKMLEALFRGQVADGFFLHLGVHHSNLFVDNTSLLNPNVLNNSKTVYQEEGKNFVLLLINAKNSTKWNTGGDFIFTSPSGEILFNILLKTTGTNDALVGSVSYVNVLKDIRWLQESLIDNNTTNEKIAEDLYERVKITAIGKRIGKKIDDTIKTLIINTLLEGFDNR